MKIIEIKIKNFRLFENFQINFENEDVIIIGENDTGKTNLFYAIRKVLDLSVRRKPFVDSDSTFNNLEDISIEVVLKAENLTSIQRSEIGVFMEEDNTVNIKYVGKYNEDLSVYEETIFLGKTDTKEFATNRLTPIDKIVEIMYINPLFNLFQDTRDFFLFQEKIDKEKNVGLTNRMKTNIDELNKILSEDQAVKGMDENFEFDEVHNEIFKDTTFKVETNINASNIYKSLDISSYHGNNKIENIGDGKRKTLSLMLKELSSNNDKKKILLLEEPENHLYPQSQRSFSNLIENLNKSQVITSTHSPYYLTYNKEKEIIKLNKSNNQTTWKSSKISSEMINEYGFLLNTSFSEMLFHDTVLLVEGSSEKYFYNKLKRDDKNFNRFLTQNNVGIFSVGGIDFSPSGVFLKKLGINVIVKTDNDIFKVPRITPSEYRYAGIQRVFNIISKETKKEIGELLKLEREIIYDDFRFKEERNLNIDKNIDSISDLLKKDGIYINTHQEGFERDFLEFIKCEDFATKLKFLQEKKLKHLHYIIKNENITLSINDENKDNVLVGFVND